MMRWAYAAAVLAGCLTAVAGCGPNQQARAVVKGQVSIDGKPLTYGNVTFRTKDGRNGSATIDPKGNYMMNDAPIGDVGVMVAVPRGTTMKGMPSTTAAPPKGLAMKSPEGMQMTVAKTIDPSQIVPIPDRYAVDDTSGLTYKVEPGEQTHDIKLTK